MLNYIANMRYMFARREPPEPTNHDNVHVWKQAHDLIEEHEMTIHLLRTKIEEYEARHADDEAMINYHQRRAHAAHNLVTSVAETAYQAAAVHSGSAATNVRAAIKAMLER